MSSYVSEALFSREKSLDTLPYLDGRFSIGERVRCEVEVGAVNPG